MSCKVPDGTPPAVVIDNGTASCKAGFAKDDAPRVIIPSVVGYPPEEAQKSCYVGGDAQAKRDILALKYPVQNGLISDWDNMEVIWRHIYQKELQVSPENQPVLLTERPLTPKANREKMAQIMFESFNTPMMYAAIQGVLALYATGNYDGVVVDSGEGVTHVVPVLGGYAVPQAIQRVDRAGGTLTDFMMRMLKERGNVLPGRETAQVIKETKCYVSQDFNADMAKTTSSTEDSYTLPDGTTFDLGNARFACPEAMFKPSLVGFENPPGLHEATYDAVRKCSEDQQGKLYRNVVMCGGNNLFPGIVDRMQKELKSLAPASVSAIKVKAVPDHVSAVWHGGSILAALDTFREHWVTKQEYQEVGPAIVNKKCA